MVSDVSLEMQSDSNNYVGLQDDEITEPVHTLFFFNKNKLNKNIEAEIAQKIRTI